MKCQRCKSEMVELIDKNNIGKLFQKEYGIPFGGRFGCLKCYPKLKEEVK